MTLRDDKGNVIANGIIMDGLPAGGRVSILIDDYFPDADTALPVGTLTVVVDDGLIAGTALEMGTLPGEFTTQPATPLRTPQQIPVRAEFESDDLNARHLRRSICLERRKLKLS